MYFENLVPIKIEVISINLLPTTGALRSFVTVFFSRAPPWIELKRAPLPLPASPPPSLLTPADALGGGGAAGGGGGGGGIVY